jgi:hypothetical protein
MAASVWPVLLKTPPCFAAVEKNTILKLEKSLLVL